MNTPSFAFWNFSLQFYGQEGVSAACLELQDRHDLDVNLVLYCLWLASVERSVREDEWGTIQQAASGIQQRAVLPLRTLRREIPKGDGPLAALRGTVQKLELLAEKEEQKALEALAQQLHTDNLPAAEAARRSFAGYLSRQDVSDPGDATRLYQGLSAKLV